MFALTHQLLQVSARTEFEHQSKVLQDEAAEVGVVGEGEEQRTAWAGRGGERPPGARTSGVSKTSTSCTMCGSRACCRAEISDSHMRMPAFCVGAPTRQHEPTGARIRGLCVCRPEEGDAALTSSLMMTLTARLTPDTMSVAS